MKIDSHHHFWSYNPDEYGWINETMKELQRNFSPIDLKAEIDNSGIDGVISVQARQTYKETQWLLDIAEKNDFIQGIVGWVDLSSPEIHEILARISANSKLKSVRHVIQDEPDSNFILHEDFNNGISALKNFSLAYDILILESQLSQTIQFVDRHPQQIFILDHIAKPIIIEGQFEPWNQKIRELAYRENVYCKISGMVTEAGFKTWTEAQLKPYFDTVLDAFSPQRLMFGSDWPVMLLASDYARWYQIVSFWISEMSSDERSRILGGTAIEAYHL